MQLDKKKSLQLHDVFITALPLFNVCLSVCLSLQTPKEK